MFTACGIKHRRCCLQAKESSAPEDGRNYRPKHVELIEIINEIIIVASSWLFILLYQRCTVTLTTTFKWQLPQANFFCYVECYVPNKIFKAVMFGPQEGLNTTRSYGC